MTWFREKIKPGGGKPENDLRKTGVAVRPPEKRDDPVSTAPRPKAPPKPAPRAAARPRSRPAQKDEINFDEDMGGTIEDAGPGKNVLKRAKYVREDVGTHEDLKIIDEDSIQIADDKDGMDPYNSGQFDRSQYWDKRSRE